MKMKNARGDRVSRAFHSTDRAAPPSPAGGRETELLHSGFFSRCVALGLELDWRWSTLETQQTSTATLAWVNFRYYWN